MSFIDKKTGYRWGFRMPAEEILRWPGCWVIFFLFQFFIFKIFYGFF